jgi:hypothetical protein
MPTRTGALVIATAGAAVIGVAIYATLQIHAGSAERTASLPGDELISNPVGVVNHADNNSPSPARCLGSGRAGRYSYDFIDNGRVPSSNQILPEYQNVAVGTVFPALPGAKDVFVVVRCEPEHNLVLSWRLPDRAIPDHLGVCAGTISSRSNQTHRARSRGAGLSAISLASVACVAHRTAGAFHNATQASSEYPPAFRIYSRLT